MTRLAADNNKRDHLLLLLMRYGLRCGEIVGWRGLPGIRIGDIRDEGIWVKGKGYAREAGIDDWEMVGPHRLRAFFATDAKDKGLDAFTIRDLMRHKNITTTNLYVGQSSPERLAKMVNQLAKT